MIRDKVSVDKKLKFTYITAGALLVVSANSVNVGETGNLKKVKKKKSQNLEKPAGKAKQKHPYSRSNLKVCIRH